MSMFGKRMLLLVLLTASMLVSGYASASEPENADRSPLKKLDLLEEWTNGLYQASVDENRQLAYSYAIRVKSLTTESELRRIGEPNGWGRIDEHVQSVIDSLNRGELSPAWREDASKLKLAVDALDVGRKSLWLQYERLLHEDISRLKKAWQRGGKEGAAAAGAALSQLRLHVSRMEAAAAVSEDPERIRTLLDRIRYAEKLIASPEQTAAQRTMAEGSFVLIGDAVDRLFANHASIVHAQAVGNPSWQWTFMLTTIVLSALAYTAWRKFSAMQRAIPVPKRPASR
jgi:hypothetical protein